MFNYDEFLQGRRNRSFYKKRRLCLQCEQPIIDNNRSGICSRCSKNELFLASLKEGSKYKTKEGYIRVRVNGVFVFEHTYVWEQSHNRKLPIGWLIHHLNGIRDDNRPENLQDMPKKNHGTWTKLYASQARVRELEKLLADTQ